MMGWNVLFNNAILIIVVIIYLMLIVSTVMVVVLDNRNPVRAMAWIVVLLFLPVIGWGLYFFFGRNTRKERLISRKAASTISRRSLQAYINQAFFGLPSEYYSLIRLFRSLNKALPFDRNEVNVYTDGYAMLTALLREIAHAKQHIHLEYYIFENDAIGRLVRDALIDKAKEGVEVRLLYDDVGCWNVSNRFYDRMRSEGIEVRGFLKVRFPLFTSRVNYRNHRKSVVIDGKVGFLGGMNIAERYLKGVNFGIWRDTHIMIKGTGVYGLQSSFLMDWFFTDGTLLSAAKYYPEFSGEGTVLVQTVTSAPVGEWRAIMQGLIAAIYGAKRYFYIQTPYFLPTEAVLNALQTAALAGVDVRLMLPARSDSVLTHLASMSYVSDVLKAGVSVFLYEAGFLHSKLIVSDDYLSTIGSTNMDFRSFEQNFEINTFMYDVNTALTFKEIFLSDQRRCRQIQEKTWQQRSFEQHVKESTARLFSPLL